MNEKERYMDEVDTKIKQWNARIDELKAKAEVAESQNRRAILEKVDELQRKRRELEQKVQKIRTAGEGAWSDLKNSTKKAVNDLEQGIQSAFSKLKE